MQECFNPDTGKREGKEHTFVYFSQSSGSIEQCQKDYKKESKCSAATSFQYEPPVPAKSKRHSACES
jgi:hypothetical protein